MKWNMLGLLVVWFLIVGFSFSELYIYGAKAGQLPKKIQSWPLHSHLPYVKNEQHLMMFVHPGCSCSKASLNELKRMIAKESIKATIVVLATPDVKDLLKESAVLQLARSIPSAEVFLDKDGSETKIFGSQTSGTVLLFNKEGGIVFTGGITSARGHEGPSLGQDRLLDLLRGKDLGAQVAEVYGCNLFSKAKRI